MNKQVDKRIITQINKLINLSFEVKQKGHDLFVEVCSHCNMVDVRLYCNGWILGKNPTYRESIWKISPDANLDKTITMFDVVISKIKELTI
jgi:hypothetical protein